ncbi:lysozyme inhibitor LprI family protein [Labrys okinawensis]|nr:lysozyme inhibitor LprI family protein [Labrys okinawensis]
MIRPASLVMIVATALAVLAWQGPAQAAGFDCRKAHTIVEKLICAHPKLSRLDDEMNRLYQAIEGETRGVDGETGAASDPFGKDQTRWRETVRDICIDAACIERAYAARIGQVRKDWASALGEGQ